MSLLRVLARHLVLSYSFAAAAVVAVVGLGWTALSASPLMIVLLIAIGARR